MNVKLKVDILFEGGMYLFRNKDPHSSPFVVLLPRHMDIVCSCVF